MGYWENTTYLQHSDATAVAAAIVDLFAREGMVQIARPAPRQSALYEPMQYATALENNLWGVAVFPGSAGWTILKTAPLELLGERAPAAHRMRFVELADRLGSGGFQINVYDSSALILIETDGRGRTLLSGHGYGNRHNPDPLMFYGEQLTEARLGVRFEILPLQSHVETNTCEVRDGHPLIDYDTFAEDLARSLGGDNAQWCDNITCVDTLLCHKPLEMTGGIDLYFRWPANDRPEDEFRAEIERIRARVAARSGA